MKKLIIAVVIIIIPLIITAFLFLVNDIIISIRLGDLKIYLQELDQNEGNIDHIGLIATYEIHKKMYEDRMTQDNADAIEQMMNSLAIQAKNKPVVPPVKYGLISLPAIQLINLNRKIIGNPPLKYRQDAYLRYADLDMAYYYERNFLFKRAIPLYEKALENTDLDSALKASILLRQGYCYALADSNQKAENNYRTVIEKYSQESSAITAVILLRYLEGFRLARERVLSGDADPVVRSQKLVNLLAYEQALKVIKDIERTADPKDLPRIKYYKARCYSGLGKPEEAFETYFQVIVKAPDSQYAKYSNRKLYLMGITAGSENKIIEISKELNKELKDPVLEQMIKDHNNVRVSEYPNQYFTNLKAPAELIPRDFIEKVESAEKSAKPAERPVEKAPPVKDTFLVIITSDGNTFKGTLIEQNESYVALQTSIGRINVKREKITQIITK